MSVNLAACENNAAYMDCDVEEPNGHLYFKPDDISSTKVYERTPEIDLEKCTACRKCADFCAFNAIAFAGKKPLIFSEVCHGCGGCAAVCPEGAVGERQREIGCINMGRSCGTRVLSGILNVGEASGMPLIAKLKEGVSNDELVVMDCPPGCGCAAMDCVRYCDLCLLVAEPTIFGVQNLEMVYELAQMFKKPVAVVLNKCGEGFNPSEEFCKTRGIRIISKIPFDSVLGRIHSEAKIAVRESEKFSHIFREILSAAKEERHG